MKKKRLNKNSGVVYSTSDGEICPDCGQPVKQCSCQQTRAIPDANSIVRIQRDAKGRRGKIVTVITGIPLEDTELVALGKKLKKKCGSGGTVKNGVVEIQGDHRELLLTELRQHGWTVKHSGG